MTHLSCFQQDYGTTISNFLPKSKKNNSYSYGNITLLFGNMTNDPEGDAPWQRGLGEIIKRVPAEDRDKVMVVPYRAEGENPLKILRALLVKSLGGNPKEQVITLRLGTQGTIAELFQGDISVDRLSSTEITAIIERTFKADLHNQRPSRRQS